MDAMNSSSGQLNNTIEFFMTSEQQLVINELLPKGYSLQFASKPARQKPNNFTLFSPINTNEIQMKNQNGIQNQSRIQRSKSNYSGQFGEGFEYEDQSQQKEIFESMSSQKNKQKNHTKTQSFPLMNHPQFSGVSIGQDDLYSSSVPSMPKRRTSEKNQKRRSEGSGGKGRGDSHRSTGMDPDDQKRCLSILTQLSKNKMAAPFLWPVDPVRQQCPDYFTIIKDPMDLGTVERNLRSHLYQSLTQFTADIRKIWNNSYLYNSRDSQIYQMTVEMDRFFERKVKETEQQTMMNNSKVKHIQDYVTILAQAINGKNPGALAQGLQQRMPAPSKRTKSVASKMDTPMTMQEKKNLGQSILQLPPECLGGIWEIVQSDCDQHHDSKLIQFDIDALSTRKTRELEQYVKQQMQNLSKKLSKKQSKVQDKSDQQESKLLNQNFGQEEDTAIPQLETPITQDHTYPTYSTAHTQPYQSQFANKQGMNQINVNCGYQQAQPKSLYPQTNSTQASNAQQSLSTTAQNEPAAVAPPNLNEHNDQDSDSSFLSGESDSRNY